MLLNSGISAKVISLLVEYLSLAIVVVAQLVTELSDILLDNDHDQTLEEETCLLPPTLQLHEGLEVNLSSIWQFKKKSSVPKMYVC